jgi:hypothetical protein
MSQQERKPTFRDLYETHQLHLAQLAHRAGVSARILFFMLEGQPILHENANSVLDTLSRETGIAYCLETVHVMLLQESLKTGVESCFSYDE